MSPLAISFFALACAALLSTAYGSGCANVGIGEYTYDIVKQRYTIPAGQRDAVINVVDNCALQNKGRVVGEEASACDYIVAPEAKLGPGFSPITVHRVSAIDAEAYVDVTQHCLF